MGIADVNRLKLLEEKVAWLEKQIAELTNKKPEQAAKRETLALKKPN